MRIWETCRCDDVFDTFKLGATGQIDIYLCGERDIGNENLESDMLRYRFVFYHTHSLFFSIYTADAVDCFFFFHIQPNSFSGCLKDTRGVWRRVLSEDKGGVC